MKISREKLVSALRIGSRKGFSGFFWMLRILIPISFFTMVLDYSGWLGKADFLLEPLMGWLSLPASAALPLIIGLLTGIYGAVAAMMVLPLTPEQMTLIAIFLLISHNMIQESIIQGNSGIHPIKATVFRLAASVITVMIAARFLIPEPAAVIGQEIAAPSSAAFVPVLKKWALETFLLTCKIFFLIMTVMNILQIMKTFDLIRYIIRGICPVLRIMGLDQRVGVLWLTACIFGIAYGGAVIVEETKENDFSHEEITRLHLSIGINHAMIEDPALFLPLGISPFWLWISRLITAVAAVHLLGLWFRIKERKAAIPVFRKNSVLIKEKSLLQRTCCTRPDSITAGTANLIVSAHQSEIP